MIHVLATIELHSPDQRPTFLSHFRKVVPDVRAEAGCIEYSLAVDVATDLLSQAPVRDSVVVVIEKWQDLAALKAHLQAPHMATYRQAVRDLILAISLQVLEPA